MNNDIVLTDLAHALTKLQKITHFTLDQIQTTIMEIASPSSPSSTHQQNPTTLLLKIHDDLREIQSEYSYVADHIMRNHVVRRIRAPAMLLEEEED